MKSNLFRTNEGGFEQSDRNIHHRLKEKGMKNRKMGQQDAPAHSGPALSKARKSTPTLGLEGGDGVNR